MDCMLLYAYVVAYKYQKPNEIVVFGSATKGATPGSETILVIDTSNPLSAEERASAQFIMRHHDILNDTIEKRPNNVNGIAIGRNEKCPCGSEKKFKKCCGNSNMRN
ncbi:SEC-C metal-binding domain-containing protein [Pseudomonas baetica]|uniref:SEC-C metal-binding domain-containing protein n=1 Tax=Pseudomonas baetica TaxID=674054 RepID=UPI003D66380E